MKSESNFAATVFFAILGLILSTIFSSIIISQNKQLLSMQNSKQNNNQSNYR